MDQIIHSFWREGLERVRPSRERLLRQESSYYRPGEFIGPRIFISCVPETCRRRRATYKQLFLKQQFITTAVIIIALISCPLIFLSFLFSSHPHNIQLPVQWLYFSQVLESFVRRAAKQQTDDDDDGCLGNIKQIYNGLPAIKLLAYYLFRINCRSVYLLAFVRADINNTQKCMACTCCCCECSRFPLKPSAP
jgi:hypothetical protein